MIPPHESQDRPRPSRWLGIALLVGLLTTGCAAGPAATPAPAPTLKPSTQAPAPLAKETHYVQSYRLNLRSCPGTKCKVTQVLRQGQQVTVVEQKGNWVKVGLEDGDQGWLAARYLGLEQPAPLAEPKAGQAVEEPPPLEEEFAAPDQGSQAPSEEFAQ